MNIIEAIEQTLIDVTHYTNYNQYIKNLSHNKTDEFNQNEADPENIKKAKLKINCIEILLNILNITPRKIILLLDIIKAHIIGKNQKNNEHPLLSELCNILIHQENFGIKYEIEELLKSLLDSELPDKKNEFYDLFYNKCLTKLVEFLSVPIKEEYKYEMVSSKQIIIELLYYCLKLSNK